MMAQENKEMIDIGKELARLAKEEQGKKLTRACFFNLIVYSPKNTSSTMNTCVNSVISKFPSRVFMITHEKQGDDVRAGVSMQTLSEGVFCEIINIDVSDSQTKRVPFLILPHILPDLPIYLLWNQDLMSDDTLLPILEPHAKRVIFNADYAFQLQKSCQSILSSMECCQADVGDLSWAGLKGWRKIFASIFDTRKSLAQLESCKTIKITYKQVRNDPCYRRAAYFQGWLASLLGWQFRRIEKSEGNIQLVYHCPMHDVVVLLIPQESVLEQTPLPPGTILEVEIEGETNKAHWMFKRNPEGRQVYYQYSDDRFCALPNALFLSGMQEGQEIVDEIFYAQKGAHYKKMLEINANIPWEQ